MIHPDRCTILVQRDFVFLSVVQSPIETRIMSAEFEVASIGRGERCLRVLRDADVSEPRSGWGSRRTRLLVVWGEGVVPGRVGHRDGRITPRLLEALGSGSSTALAVGRAGGVEKLGGGFAGEFVIALHGDGLG